MLNESAVMVMEIMCLVSCAGIAQCSTHDSMVTGLSPCRSSGRIFFSRVSFLFWLLFRYLFWPRVTAVARKRSWSFCQKCRGRLQLNTHTPYVCGFAWSDVYTERTEMAAVSCDTSHVSAVSALWWIFKNVLLKASCSCRITCEHSESAQ